MNGGRRGGHPRVTRSDSADSSALDTLRLEGVKWRWFPGADGDVGL
jgi:hypothetical protein